jgi:cob(I)alamin adenosyltransferase
MNDKKTKEEIEEKRKIQNEIEDKSIIMVFTGEGKGKTTAAFGTVMRTIGHGWTAAIVQFMKSPSDYHYGEVKIAEKLNTLDIFTMGAGFTWNTKNIEQDKKLALEAWNRAVEIMESQKYRLVMLDEILYAIHYKFLSEDMVIKWLKNKPKGLNVILTGRNASPKIIKTADLVTEMKNIKHPYKEKNLLAQKGIDW